jgi:hypothetical protein
VSALATRMESAKETRLELETALASPKASELEP